MAKPGYLSLKIDPTTLDGLRAAARARARPGLTRVLDEFVERPV